VVETKNKEFLACGTTKSTDGNNDIFLAKLSPNGQVLDKKIFGGLGSDWGNALCIKKNGDVVEVRVGSVAHPMADDHYIEWIELLTEDEVFRKSSIEYAPFSLC